MCKLNEQVKLTLAPSPIHGIGVFAIRHIKEGEKMYCRGLPNDRWIKLDSLKDLRPEVRKLILQRWPLAKEGGIFQSPHDDARLLSFMNHSNTPNYNKVNDTALRDIREGEEITEDYGTDLAWVLDL